MDNSNKFGNNLRQLRKNLQLKQDEMPVHIGVKRATWSDYERGHTEPDLETLIKIAKFFGVSIDELLQKNFERDDYNVEINGKKGRMENGIFIEINEELNIERKESLHVAKRQIKNDLIPKDQEIDNNQDNKLKSATGADYYNDLKQRITQLEGLVTRLIKNNG